ncbi:MAG: hypothetical protein ACLQBD_01995 [Syntrophobacteraceae bacterium]
MRELHLMIGAEGEILDYRILAMGLGDELIVRAALNRILEKENPAAATAGQDTKTDDDLG